MGLGRRVKIWVYIYFEMPNSNKIQKKFVERKRNKIWLQPLQSPSDIKYNSQPILMPFFNRRAEKINKIG